MNDNLIATFRPTDARRHLIPAMYYWFLENDPVVYLTVLADFQGMNPRQMAPFRASLKSMNVPVARPDGSNYAYLRQDALILNIGLAATRAVRFLEDRVSVDMRLNGKAVSVDIPYGAIVAIYVPVTEKVQALQFQLPFAEEAILSNGTPGIGADAANELMPDQPQAAAVGLSEAASVTEQAPAPLDFSMKDTKKERPSFLRVIK